MPCPYEKGQGDFYWHVDSEKESKTAIGRMAFPGNEKAGWRDLRQPAFGFDRSAAPVDAASL
jgi:hypothetical protein